MKETPFALSRAFAIWMTMLAVESLHGAARRLVLEPHLGDLPARQVSVVTGSLLILIVFRFTLRWLGPQTTRRWWQMGSLWLTLTLAFEIGIGRAAGASWDRIASDFDLARGGFLGLGMLVILVAPPVLAERLGLIKESAETSTRTISPR